MISKSIFLFHYYNDTYVNSSHGEGGRSDTAGRPLYLTSFFYFPEASSGQAVFLGDNKKKKPHNLSISCGANNIHHRLMDYPLIHHLITDEFASIQKLHFLLQYQIDNNRFHLEGQRLPNLQSTCSYIHFLRIPDYPICYKS